MVDYAEVFSAHRDRIWGLCYRMTGSAAEAEDLLQETFRRAIESPPTDLSRPWAPWLARVATRLSIDALRRRRTRGYTGPWLPEPVLTEDDDQIARLSADLATSDAEVRYGTLESASFAFVAAMEALSPLQRAVLILRDVMSMSGPEVAEILERTEANVRVTLMRARQAMARYDEHRVPPSAEHDARTMATMQRFMAALVARDAQAMAACLRADVVCTNDGGGIYHAALKPLHGVERVVKFHLGVARKGAGMPSSVRWVRINGAPALYATFDPPGSRNAPAALVRCDLDADGRVWQVHSLLQPDKLAALGL